MTDSEDRRSVWIIMNSSPDYQSDYGDRIERLCEDEGWFPSEEAASKRCAELDQGNWRKYQEEIDKIKADNLKAALQYDALVAAREGLIAQGLTKEANALPSSRKPKRRAVPMWDEYRTRWSLDRHYAEELKPGF